jgi:putative FmdB family regulatory protein
MPLYEFRCNNCGIFDEWRHLNDSSNPADCPSCNQTAKRIFSAIGVKLNGSLRLNKTANPEPRLVTKTDPNTENRTRPRSHGGRPWMINH